MAIKQTEQILLNGSQQAYGGFIYNANYNIGFGANPSSLTLSIVSESGDYNINKSILRIIGSPDVIILGSQKKVRMFPMKYSFEKSSGGKILQVSYVDESVKFLDKKFVLLRGIHVPLNQPISEEIIPLGKRYQVREVEKTSVRVEEDPDVNYTKVGQTLYSAKDLKNALINAGISLSRIGTLLDDDEYLQNYTGTLRAVLSAWGKDIGFTFFWNENSQLEFIDLSSDIPVNTSKLNGIRFNDERDSYTLENTFVRGSSFYYGEDGGQASLVTVGGRKTRTLKLFQPSESVVRNIFRNVPASEQLLIDQELIGAALMGEQFFQAYVFSFLLRNGGGGNYKGIQDEQWGISKNKPISNLTDKVKNYLTKEFDVLKDLDTSNSNKFSEFYVFEGINLSGQIGEGLKKLASLIGRFYYRSINYKNYAEYSPWTPTTEWFNKDLNISQTPFGNFIDDSDTNLSELLEGEFSSSSLDTNVLDGSGYMVTEVNPESFIPPVNQDIVNNLINSIVFLNPINIPDSLAVDYDIKKLRFAAITSDANQAFENAKKALTTTDLYSEYAEQTQSLLAEGQKRSSPSIFFSSREEEIIFEHPERNQNVVATEMQIENISEEQIYLGDGIGNIANLLNRSLTRNEPDYEKTFSINGIDLPENITIQDGLQSLTINFSDSGVKSTYKIGNRFKILPTQDIKIQELQREKRVEVLGRRITVVLPSNLPLRGILSVGLGLGA